MSQTDQVTKNYAITISPKYLIENLAKGQAPIFNSGGQITIGITSQDSNASLGPNTTGALGLEITQLSGGYAITWNLDASKTANLKTLEVLFEFKDTTPGNVSWNVFSLDYNPSSGPGVTGKYLPVVFIGSAGTDGIFQNNQNEVPFDDFVMSGPGLETTSTFPAGTIFGPSGANLSVAKAYIQVFDTIELQPVYLVQPPASPIPDPYNFIFRGDRPLGLYMVDGRPYAVDLNKPANDPDIEKCANNQFIDFPKLYECMKQRFNEQASGRGANFPTIINFLDVSITDINQRYTDIPTTDLPYQELRSFNQTVYQPTTTQQQYEDILDGAKLNMNLPATATIGTFTDKDQNVITFTSASKFAWVDLGTTNSPTFTPGQTASFYAAELMNGYGINAADFRSFINDVINYQWFDNPNYSTAGNVVYIHCNAGTMRTGTFLTCMLLTQHADITLEKAALYGTSLFGDDAGTVRTVAPIGDYWPLVQNYCAYLDLVTQNINPRNAGMSEPTNNPFADPTSLYAQYPNPWQWRQTSDVEVEENH